MPFEGSHGKHKMLDFPTGITVKDDRLSRTFQYIIQILKSSS